LSGSSAVPRSVRLVEAISGAVPRLKASLIAFAGR
jgi:hypothetical protein